MNRMASLAQSNDAAAVMRANLLSYKEESEKENVEVRFIPPLCTGPTHRPAWQTAKITYQGGDISPEKEDSDLASKLAESTLEDQKSSEQK